MEKLRLRVKKTKITAVGIRCADHTTPLYQLKLALTSSAGCGRLIGIVRLRTKTTEFSFFLVFLVLVITFTTVSKRKGKATYR
jgi:hypothetical protein